MVQYKVDDTNLRIHIVGSKGVFKDLSVMTTISKILLRFYSESL